MVVCARLAGRIPATIAGLLLATVGASPFIESFTFSGELLASLAAVLSMIAFLLYLRHDAWPWLVACGLLTGCAVMIKQSGFDAGLAAVAFLLLTRRRGGLIPAAVIVATAAVPVLIGYLSAPSQSDWWYAMVTYRGQGDSILSGSIAERWHQFRVSWGPLLKADAALFVLAAYGWRTSPLVARLWLVAAALGVLGGGNFHNHYYLQLAPPLAILAGCGAARAIDRRAGLVAGIAVALALWSAYVTVPLWLDSPVAQARAVFPDDGHLQHDGPVIDYIRAHTRPGQRIFVMWAAANVQYLSDRPPAVRYLWYRNIQAIPGAVAGVRRVLAGPNPPVLIVGEQPASELDPSGATGRLIQRRYRRVATISGIPVYRLRP